MPDMKRLAAMSRQVALVGIGDTDYAADYGRARQKLPCTDSYGYAARAFKRALDDAGLHVSDIDGLIAGPTLSLERTGEILGIDPRWAAQGDAINALMHGMLAIQTGVAETVALVYGNAQRTGGVKYGGPTADARSGFLSYVYYAPWGMTSQGALYAMMTQRYMALHDFGPRDLGEVAVALRAHASLNPNAVMQTPVTLDDYMDARFIVEPLRLLDYCLVNDGGVALILTTVDRARRLRADPPIAIAGVGRSEANVDATSLRPRLMDFYHTGHAAAAEQLYAMAGLGPKDIDSVQVYDSFSAHVVFALEGFGFCPMGEVAGFLRGGTIGPGGKLPVNTSGGHLSDSYMQGWNHQVEAVRQLRHAAGRRQVKDCRHVQYISDVAGKVVSLIYERMD